MKFKNVILAALTLMVLWASPAFAGCNWVKINVGGAEGEWKLECDDDGIPPPPPDPIDPNAGIGHSGAGGGNGSGSSAENERKERCAANKRLFDSLTCNSRPTIKPVDTSQLGISSSNLRTDLWGPAALGLATRSFDGALNQNDFQRALREGLNNCGQEQPCISEVLIYFGVNTFPTYNSVTDFLNWAYTYLASQTFGPNVYGDSAAGRMASRWELGAACNTLRQNNINDSCAP
jgi:hypothetical protein